MPVIRTCANCGQKNRIPGKNLASTGRCGACKAQLLPAAAPIDADPALLDEVAQHSPVPVLVDFWAAWCGPCRMAAPEVARTAAEMAGQAIVLKVDTERHPTLAARYQVNSIPNFVVLSGGRPVLQKPGLVNHVQMKTWLRSASRQPSQ